MHQEKTDPVCFEHVTLPVPVSSPVQSMNVCVCVRVCHHCAVVAEQRE